MSKKNLIIILGLIMFFLFLGIIFLINKDKNKKLVSRRCGNGICDVIERRNAKFCPEDCKEKIDHRQSMFEKEATDFSLNSTDSPFGFHYASKLEDYSSDLGIKWVRVNAVWDIVQKEEDIINNNFDWDAFEDDVKLNSYPEDTNFLITFSVLGTPISKGGSYVLADGNYKKENWIKFVEAVVERYGDRVKYFQVENEPKPQKKNFAELQEITYKAVKEECSECQVVMGGSFWGMGNFEEWNRNNVRILKALKGKYVDIFDQHYGGDLSAYNPSLLLSYAKTKLAEAGFQDTRIWITEMSDYSGDPKEDLRQDPLYQSENDQAGSLFKRYVSSLSFGVEKIFWAIGIYEGFQYEETYFDFTGLIYDGKYDHDLGRGVKKLAYYTYKLMTEKLEGSDWNNIKTIQESDDIYIYQFTNKNTNKKTWVAWSDEGVKSVSLDFLGITSAKTTEVVPDYENGKEVENVLFEDMFKEIIVSNSFELDDVPVFIESN